MHIRIEPPAKHGGHFKVSAIEKGAVVAEATAKDAAEANRLMAEAHANGVETLRGGGKPAEATKPNEPDEKPPGFLGGPRRRELNRKPAKVSAPFSKADVGRALRIKPASKAAKRRKAKKAGK